MAILLSTHNNCSCYIQKSLQRCKCECIYVVPHYKYTVLVLHHISTSTVICHLWYCHHIVSWYLKQQKWSFMTFHNSLTMLEYFWRFPMPFEHLQVCFKQAFQRLECDQCDQIDNERHPKSDDVEMHSTQKSFFLVLNMFKSHDTW